MEKEAAERLIQSGASSPGDVALAVLWLRHLTKGAKGVERDRFRDLDAIGLKRAGLPPNVDRRTLRNERRIAAIREGKILAQMERLRAIIRSDHPYVTVKEHRPLEWTAAMRLCDLGEAETWALVFKKDRTGRGEGRKWWTITRAENEEDERI